MDSLQIIILALLQGLTEFLPISSSAHLILPAQILGWSDQGLAFDVAVHVGTLAAVVLYFKKDLFGMGTAWLRSLGGGKSSQDSRMAWFVIWGTLPAVIAGYLVNGGLEDWLRDTRVIAWATLVFGLFLFMADRWGAQKRVIGQLNVRDVLLIGLAQALALIPGTSRSGVTITAALALGLSRAAAARFSFLLSVPIISAAGMLKLIELIELGERVDWTGILLGVTVSFVSAFLCIGWFLKVIERMGLLPFVLYRFALGLILLFFFS